MRLSVVVLLLAPLAAAQAPDAAHLSPDVQTLYAHGADDDPNGWMNSAVDDGNDDALPAGSMTDSSFTWTFTLDPPITRAVRLGEGDIEVTAYLGASQGVGQVDVTTRIDHGDDTLATGSSQSHTVTPATANSGGLYGSVTWSLAPAFTELVPGQPLVWVVTVEGSASALFLSTAEGRGRSNIVLPVAGVEPAAAPPPELGTTHENLTGASIDLALDEVNATGRWVYNWTTDLAAVDVHVAGVASSGWARVRIVDGAGEALVDTSMAAGNGSAGDPAGNGSTGDPAGNGTAGNGTAGNGTAGNGTAGNVTLSAAAAGPGNWTVEIEFAAYTGSLQVQVTEPAAGPAGPGEDGPADEPGRDSPLPVALVLAALLLASRRRGGSR